MIQKRYVLLVSTLVLGSLQLLQATEWQLWTNFSLKNNVNKNLTSSFNQEMRYQDDMTNFFYVHLEPAFLLKTFKKNSFGFEMRGIFNKNSSFQWVFEARPTIVFHHKILNREKFTLHTRNRLYGRIKGSGNNTAALRSRIGLDFFKTKHFYFYSTLELFYNHQNFQELDRVRVAFGMKWDISKELKAGMYYLHQDDKKSAGAGRSGFHVLGLTLAAKY